MAELMSFSGYFNFKNISFKFLHSCERKACVDDKRFARSINKIAPGFPVAEHFSSNGHTAADALVRGIKLCEGNKQRKRQEVCLIFRLWTCQPRGLNADFQFI